jgi:hypothetical protein
MRATLTRYATRDTLAEVRLELVIDAGWTVVRS